MRVRDPAEKLMGESSSSETHAPLPRSRPSRRGFVRGGQVVEDIPGPYAEQPGWVLQQAASLFHSEYGHAVVGSWIVGSEPCGIGIREDASAITMNLSRFVPHVILDDADAPISGEGRP